MGKLTQRVGRGIKLAPAMVRDHQPVDARAYSPLGILPVKNAFQQKLARPAVAQKVQIIPVKAAIQLRSDEFGHRHIAKLVGIGLEIPETRTTVRQHPKRPFRTDHRLHDHTRRVHGFAAASHRASGQAHPLATARPGHIGRHHKCLHPAICGAAQHVKTDVAVVRRVELEPGHVAADLRHPLDGIAGDGAQGVRKTVCLGCLGENLLRARPDCRRQADRRDTERHAVGPAEELCRRVRLNATAKELRRQMQLAIGGLIGILGKVAPGAGIEILEYEMRDTSLCLLLQVGQPRVFHHFVGHCGSSLFKIK